MLLTCDQVREMIEKAIPGSRVEVGDLTGTSDHFDVSVLSAAFEGKSRIEQHKMVHAALGAYLGREIHAVQIKTATS